MLPFFRISKMQIIYCSVMFVPALATWVMLRPDKRSDNQFHEKLAREFPQHVKVSKTQQEELQTFFNKMKSGDADQDAKFNSVLRQGKDNIVARQHDRQRRRD